MSKAYRAKNGRIQHKPSMGWLTSVVEGDNDLGFCLNCAEEISGVEPDAERDSCPSCYEHKVYGAEQLLLIGLCYDEDYEADVQQARAEGYIR